MDTAVQALEDRDYFTDHSILKDPYGYFEAVRAKGPIYQSPGSSIVVITGFEEIVAILPDNADLQCATKPTHDI